MAEYIWKIEKMETYAEVEQYKDFVSSVKWSISAKENDKIATEEVTFSYKPEDSVNYIPYNQLTEEIVLGWVKDRLQQVGIEHFENLVLNKLSKSEPPPVENKPLPWG